MRLVYDNVGHTLCFGKGYVNELVVEHRRLFFDMVNHAILQADGGRGSFVLSIANKPVEFGKYTDIVLQFAPFQLNRKSLLTKLYGALEQKALGAEAYMETTELLSDIEGYMNRLAEDFAFDIACKKVAIGPVIRALAPEIDEVEQSPLEKIFTYMELVRELDRDRLFIMVHMRSYFSDADMEQFVESVNLHDFKVLLLESSSFPVLKNTKRFTIDEDLCEF